MKVMTKVKAGSLLPGELGEVRYGESIFVGYRYYQAKHVTPQFPFGYGLSYTTFQLDNLRLSSNTLDVESGQTIVAAVDVTNTGDRPGKEVVPIFAELGDTISAFHKL